jgi:hypothetical protein
MCPFAACGLCRVCAVCGNMEEGTSGQSSGSVHSSSRAKEENLSETEQKSTWSEEMLPKFAYMSNLQDGVS